MPSTTVRGNPTGAAKLVTLLVTLDSLPLPADGAGPAIPIGPEDYVDYLRYSDERYDTTPRIRERAYERTPWFVLLLAALPGRSFTVWARERLEEATTVLDAGHACDARDQEGDDERARRQPRVRSRGVGRSQDAHEPVREEPRRAQESAERDSGGGEQTSRPPRGCHAAPRRCCYSRAASP